MCSEVMLLSVVLIVVLVKLNDALKETGESAADFRSIVNTPSFIDESLLIKGFLEDSNKRILLTSPRKSGRSVSMDMIRRFLEIQVNQNGEVAKINETENYKLFKDNDLKILKHDEFFKDHFGRYPVIYLDCQPLRTITNYHELLFHLREMLRNIYTRHQYLLKYRHLWLDDLEVEHFRDFVMKNRKGKLNPTLMVRALAYLSEILNLHFGRRVIVLVDDYDAFVDSVDFQFNADLDRITRLLQKLYTRFLKNNRFVDRALATGVDREESDPPPAHCFSVLPTNFVRYSHRDDRSLGKYFRYTFS